MKQISLILAALILASALVSCSDAKGDSSSTAATASVTTSSADTTADDSNFGAASRKYANTDFDGYTARFLVRGTGESSFWNEIYYDEQSGEVLSDSIVARNRQVEELLNIKIEAIWTDDGFEGALNNAQNAILAGEDAYDFVLTSMQFVLTPLARQGMLMNLNDVGTLNLSDAWWDANIVNNFTLFGDTLYQISGDFNFFDDYASAGLLINKKLCESVGFDVPYQAVRDGSGTIDKLGEMCTAFAQDINADGKITLADKVGYLDNSGIMIHNYYSAGRGLTSMDSDGNLYYNMEEQSCIDTIDRIKTVFGGGGWAVSSDQYDDIRQKFIDGDSLFYASAIGGLMQIRDMEDDFGVLPNPKITEAQSGYGAFVSNGWLSAASIPVTASDPERSGVILDCMAMLSTETVKTAVYDMMLSSKLVRDDESVEMMNEYIMPCRVYDYVSDIPGGDNMLAILTSQYKSSSNTYASSLQKKLPAANEKLATFLSDMKGE
ncbi:MAG: hypothetical protein WCQ72_03355 [Eubacteriales bacterium]